jgi:truncated hemoglobin YjbI
MARKTKAQRKERRKKFFSKAKEAVKKIATAPAKAAAYVILLPFQPMMRSMLEKRGFKPKKKLKDLVEQFYNDVVKKENLEEGFESEYLENADAGLVVGTITDIVTAVKNWIGRRKEKLKEKEAAGEVLTEGEKNFVDNTEAIEGAAKEAIREGIKENVSQKAGDFITSPVGLILVAAVAYFGFIKK